MYVSKNSLLALVTFFIVKQKNFEHVTIDKLNLKLCIVFY